MIEFAVAMFLALEGASACLWVGSRDAMGKPMWALRSGGQAYLAIAPVVCAVMFVIVAVYGFWHFTWWAPVVVFVIAFFGTWIAAAVAGASGIVLSALVTPTLSVLAAAWLIVRWVL
jgi:hypothetical protein